jgi:antitoxin ChpS
MLSGVTDSNRNPDIRYTLEELLAQCDPEAAPSNEDREWLDDGPAGAELL